MYDFRETTLFTGSDDNQHPAEAMLIDGQYIEDLIPGYSTLQVSGRELLSQSIEKQTIGKSDGEGKNVNGPDKNCPVLPNAYGCHLNSRIIRSFISV